MHFISSGGGGCEGSSCVFVSCSCVYRTPRRAGRYPGSRFPRSSSGALFISSQQTPRCFRALQRRPSTSRAALSRSLNAGKRCLSLIHGLASLAPQKGRTSAYLRSTGSLSSDRQFPINPSMGGKACSDANPRDIFLHERRATLVGGFATASMKKAKRSRRRASGGSSMSQPYAASLSPAQASPPPPPGQAYVIKEEAASPMARAPGAAAAAAAGIPTVAKAGTDGS